MSDKECVWRVDDVLCSGKVSDVAIFNNQISLPICEAHFEQHKEIMTLHQNGHDIEEILKHTEEWRKQEINKLVQNGVDISKTTL